MISAEAEAAILRLHHQEGWPIGTIARQLGVHHSVVTRVIDRAGVPRMRRFYRSKLDRYVGFLQETLRHYPDLTASRLHAMARERGHVGSESHFRRLVARLRPRPAAEAYLRLRTLAGEQGQVDWGHFGHREIGRAKRQVLGFVLVLSYSRAIFLRFYFGASTENFLRGHQAAFEHWGGTPRVLLYDNLKSAVLERFGDAIRFHPLLRDFASHYGYEPRPVAVARGNEKGRVERAIRYIRSSFYAARTWQSLEELNAQALEWCRGQALERTWPEDRARTVAEVLAEESASLLRLPANPFPLEERREVSIGKTPYARFESNDYSVPHRHVRRTLTVLASEQRVRLLDGAQVLADHPRSYGKGEQVEEAAHIEALVREKNAAGAHRRVDRLARLVPSSSKLLEALADRGEKLAAATRQLEQLLDRYDARALERAVRASLDAGACHVHAVRHLLELEQRKKGELPRIPVELPTDPRVRALRVTPHELTTYDTLVPCAVKPPENDDEES